MVLLESVATLVVYLLAQISMSTNILSFCGMDEDEDEASFCEFDQVVQHEVHDAVDTQGYDEPKFYKVQEWAMEEEDDDEEEEITLSVCEEARDLFSCEEIKSRDVLTRNWFAFYARQVTPASSSRHCSRASIVR